MSKEAVSNSPYAIKKLGGFQASRLPEISSNINQHSNEEIV